mgnify:CR=1 FL=1
MNFKKEIIKMVEKLDSRKLILVYWHIRGLLGI